MTVQASDRDACGILMMNFVVFIEEGEVKESVADEEHYVLHHLENQEKRHHLSYSGRREDVHVDLEIERNICPQHQRQHYKKAESSQFDAPPKNVSPFFRVLFPRPRFLFSKR